MFINQVFSDQWPHLGLLFFIKTRIDEQLAISRQGSVAHDFLENKTG
jgi:hypothetical protein